MSRLVYPSEIKRAAQLEAQLQVDALLGRAGRRSTDVHTNRFEQLREDCGRFWLLVITASPVVAWLTVLAIGLIWRTDAVQTVVLALRNQP